MMTNRFYGGLSIQVHNLGTRAVQVMPVSDPVLTGHGVAAHLKVAATVDGQSSSLDIDLSLSKSQAERIYHHLGGVLQELGSTDKDNPPTRH